MNIIPCVFRAVSKKQLPAVRTIRATKLLALLFLLLPAVVQAQFTFTTNNGTITITGYTGAGGGVIIPSETNGLPVTAFTYRVFSINRIVTSVTIPDSVSNIPDNAFYGCCGLTNVTIPNSVTNIGQSAFGYCTNLASVTIPTNVMTFAYGVFGWCSGLTNVNFTIPSSITSIGEQAFYQCTNLANVTIPNSVTNLAGAVFMYCSALTNVTLPNSITNIRLHTFSYCTSLSSIKIPNRVTVLEFRAFWNCLGLTGIYFQGNAPSLDQATFLGAGYFTAYYLPGTTNWGTTFAGRPTALWKPVVQTSDASFGVRTNQFGFNINWASGMVAVVEACSNPANPAWLPLTTNTFTTDSFYFSDPQWANYPARLYRIRSP